MVIRQTQSSMISPRSEEFSPNLLLEKNGKSVWDIEENCQFQHFYNRKEVLFKIAFRVLVNRI